jgi:hypothetical protein
LGERLLGEDEQGAAGAASSLTKAKPCGEGDAQAMFRGGRAEVEDEGGKAAGLEQEIGSADGLVEPSPWFGG